jgi:hypothetical protein
MIPRSCVDAAPGHAHNILSYIKRFVIFRQVSHSIPAQLTTLALPSTNAAVFYMQAGVQDLPIREAAWAEINKVQQALEQVC